MNAISSAFSPPPAATKGARCIRWLWSDSGAAMLALPLHDQAASFRHFVCPFVDCGDRGIGANTKRSRDL